MKLSEDNKKAALLILDSYLKAGEIVIRKKDTYKKEEFQRLRVESGEKIRALLNSFFKDKIELGIFKTEVDRINKRNELWGFKGIKGQMFFNQLYKICDKKELVSHLKDAFALPKDIDGVEEKIRNFEAFVISLGQNVADRRKLPKPSAILYFLSYFWQISDKDKFPVFFTSMEQSFLELGLMPEMTERDKYYSCFYELNNELRDLFKAKTDKNFSYWDVEHVFWYYRMTKPTPVSTSEIKIPEISGLDEDYIPPVVKCIPSLAKGIIDPLEKQNKQVEDLLEDKVYKLFVMLGYEVEKLGKGKGRVPDGVVLSRQDGYAIIYDTKSRIDGYDIGTDDRVIKEYINTYSNKLRKDGIKNIYFLIISSDFKGDYEEAIKSIKMETDAKEVLLLRADLLLYILELTLKDSEIDLDQEGLQQVFAYSGVISKEEIQEMLIGI